MELRKDYFLNRWVILSEKRGKRPSQFVEVSPTAIKECVFCPGSENLTPPELFRVEKDGKWKLRVIPNKFSAVDPSGDANIQTHNQFYTFGGDHGKHEVIIETNEHEKKFGDLTVEDIVELMKVYSARINELKKDFLAKYVCVFKNQGKAAGASLAHTHSQIVSFSLMPPVVNEKIDAMKRYPSCPYCQIIKTEKDSHRRCYENANCVAFTPYASRFNNEIWVFPKNHLRVFEDFNDSVYQDMAWIIKQACMKLESINSPYNIEWYYSPNNENLHFHAEISPRTQIWAGFEIGFGITINDISPEQAARFYRGEI
jgi:UDPglucose--hexose-1-phosphate uridylyltransferase